MRAIVTLCGSTRFRHEFTNANRIFTLTGWIVLAPGVFSHDGDEITEDQKIELDMLHLHKIDMANLVYVVNPNGYIGNSTRREIAHARAAGKDVIFMRDCDATRAKWEILWPDQAAIAGIRSDGTSHRS